MQVPAEVRERLGAELLPRDGVGSAGVTIEVGEDAQGCGSLRDSVVEGDVHAEAIVSPVDGGVAVEPLVELLAEGGGDRRGTA